MSKNDLIPKAELPPKSEFKRLGTRNPGQQVRKGLPASASQEKPLSEPPFPPLQDGTVVVPGLQGCEDLK